MLLWLCITLANCHGGQLLQKLLGSITKLLGSRRKTRNIGCGFPCARYDFFQIPDDDKALKPLNVFSQATVHF